MKRRLLALMTLACFALFSFAMAEEAVTAKPLQKTNSAKKTTTAVKQVAQPTTTLAPVVTLSEPAQTVPTISKTTEKQPTTTAKAVTPTATTTTASVKPVAVPLETIKSHPMGTSKEREEIQRKNANLMGRNDMRRWNLMQALEMTPDLSMLASLLRATDLSSSLEMNGQYILFAPTNEAIAKFSTDKLATLANNKEALRNLLLNHMVREHTNSLGSTQMYEEANRMNVSPETSTHQDIICTNGFIRPIDRVLETNIIELQHTK